MLRSIRSVRDEPLHPNISAVRERHDSRVETPDRATEQAENEAAIAAGAGGDAYQGLAIALFWQNDRDGALRAMEQAYVQLRRRADHGRAAWAALWLGVNIFATRRIAPLPPDGSPDPRGSGGAFGGDGTGDSHARPSLQATRLRCPV